MPGSATPQTSPQQLLLLMDGARVAARMFGPTTRACSLQVQVFAGRDPSPAQGDGKGSIERCPLP
jgi:hypothetical protein